MNMPAGVADQAAADDTSLHDELAAAMNERIKQDESGDTGAASPEPDAQAAGRARDGAGRFAAKDAAAPQDAAADPAAQAQQDAAAQGQDGQAAQAPAGPPPGWSVASKAVFDTLPEHVRADVAKREAEVNRGLAKLRDYKALDPYVEMARQSNSSLPQVIENYVKAEQFLSTDPVNAILWLCQSYGVDPGSLTGGQAQQAPAAPQQPAFDIQPLYREINTLKSTIIADKQAQVRTELEKFYSDPSHKYADNVADQMAGLIRSGQASTLKDAYDKACWLNTEIRALLINEQQAKSAADQAARAKAAASQARAASRSITGGPSATPPPPADDSDNLRASLEQAFAGARA
jgi:hypothetical protein